MFKRLKFNDKKVIGDIETNKAAIANGGSGGTGGDLSEIENRLSALENPVSISSFIITSPTDALEVGATLTTLGISWTIKNATSGIVRDVTNSNNIHTVGQASGTATITGLSIRKTSPGNNSFQLQSYGANSTTRNVSWQWAYYFGNSANTTLTEAQVKALTRELRSSATSGTYGIAVSSGYKHILIPKLATQPSSFKDSTGFAVIMKPPVEVTITNNAGLEVVYNDYCTDSPINEAITITAVA